MRATKKLSLLLAIVSVLMISGLAQATGVDFHTVALRGANSDGSYGTITENAAGSGATAYTSLAGQKVYYGTNFFNGYALSEINYIQFDYSGPATAPYVNLAVTDGTNWGVLALFNDLDPAAGVVRYGIAGYGSYEQTGTWAGSAIPDTVSLGTPRTPSTGELLASYNDLDPRGPIYDSLVVMWGDSQANYVGGVTISNLVVSTTRGDFEAVPEPASILLLGLGLVGLAGFGRRMK